MERFNRNEMETVARLERYESVTTVKMEIRDLVSEQFWIIDGRKKLAYRIAFDKDTCSLRLIESEDCSMDAPVVKSYNKIMLVVMDGEARIWAYFLGMQGPYRSELALAGDTSAEELIEAEYQTAVEPKHLENGTEVEFTGMIANYEIEFVNGVAYTVAYARIEGQAKSYKLMLIARGEMAERFESLSGKRVSGSGIVTGWCHRSDASIELKSIEFRA